MPPRAPPACGPHVRVPHHSGTAGGRARGPAAGSPPGSHSPGQLGAAVAGVRQRQRQRQRCGWLGLGKHASRKWGGLWLGPPRRPGDVCPRRQRRTRGRAEGQEHSGQQALREVSSYHLRKPTKMQPHPHRWPTQTCQHRLLDTSHGPHGPFFFF